MNDPIKAFALCFTGVFCLTPLAIYLLWLAAVNRRPRPTVISGPWDFVSLMAGLSGFLIFGAPIVILATQSNSRFGLRGNFEQLRASWNQENAIWLSVVGVYTALVVTAILVGIVRRKRTLAVYAADPDGLAGMIDQQVHDVGGPFPRSGNTWGPHIRLEPFAGMGHSVIRISVPDAAKADELERRLREAIPHATPAATTPAAWLQIAAVGCGIGATCSLGLVILYWWMSR